MCSSRKYPYLPQGRLTEILRGRGVSKPQCFEGKYDSQMENPGEGYRYFLEQHFLLDCVTFLIEDPNGRGNKKNGFYSQTSIMQTGWD